MESKEGEDEVALGHVLSARVVSALRRHGFEEVTRLVARHGSKKGDHFMSLIRKIKASGKTSEGSEINLSLVAKCLPTNQMWKNTFDVDRHFKKEVGFYCKIWPALADFWNKNGAIEDEDPNIIPKCYETMSDGCNDFILMEDLLERGFSMGDSVEGLCLERALLVIRSMGKFHALSYALAEKEPHLLEEMKGFTREEFLTAYNADKYARSFGQQVRSATEGVRTLCPESAEKLDAFLGTGVYDRMVDLVEQRDRFAVINLGDCWTNNLFFRDSKGGVPEEMRFIDFQLVRYGSPVLDISYFLFTSTEKSMREEHMLTLLEEYHKSVVRTLTRLSCENAETALTFSDLEEQMKKYAIFGLYMALILVPLYHLDKNEAPDVETSEDDALVAMVRFHHKVMKEKKVQLKVTSLVKQCAQLDYI